MTAVLVLNHFRNGEQSLVQKGSNTVNVNYLSRDCPALKPPLIGVEPIPINPNHLAAAID